MKSCAPLREPEVWLDILAVTISTAELAQKLDDNYFAYLASRKSGAAT